MKHAISGVAKTDLKPLYFAQMTMKINNKRFLERNANED